MAWSLHEESMRRLLILLPVFALLGCDNALSTHQAAPVDPVTLGAMSGKEQALMVAAEGAERTGDKASAERDYQNAIAQSRGHVEAHLGLAKLYLGQKRTDQARAILIEAAKWQPKHPQVNYLLGKTYLADNDPKQADAAFARGLQTMPNDFNLLNGSGIAADMMNDHERAQAYYTRAMGQRSGEDLTMVRTNLAMSYLLSNEPKKAVELLKEEAKQSGASAVTRHNLALAYGMIGRNTEAKQLVHSEMTEDDRKMALERLKKYIATEPRLAPPANMPGGPKGTGSKS
jgi:Flp pilus assembly protein TadD